MTPRQIRRAIERRQRKLEEKLKATLPSPEQTGGSQPSTRAEIHRANAQHSTGPRTGEGKKISSQNSFKHGLYSKQLVLPNENAAELDDLRAKLRSEHQPANITEEILVNEIAESFWRVRRMRSLEAHCMQRTDFSHLTEMLPTVHRAMASAERSFHKALSTLRRLQIDRGFVPQKKVEPQQTAVEAADVDLENGFVPQNFTSSGSVPLPGNEFVSQNGHHPPAQAA